MLTRIFAFFIISGVVATLALQLPAMLSYATEPTGHSDSVSRETWFRVALRQPADSICLIKHRREMCIYRHGALLKIYRVALGYQPVGQKHFKGDYKTPEGLYFIDSKNPQSGYHKNLGISYPNAADRAYAKHMNRATGGDVKIHGLPNGEGDVGADHLLEDWTYGCIALTNEEIDELYAHVQAGVPIYILP